MKRTASDLRAALNRAATLHNLPPGFTEVVRHGLAAREAKSPTARYQILADADVRAIVAAAWEIDREDGWDGDLARMVMLLAATGARFSQIVPVRVGDVDAGGGKIMVPRSAKGRGEKAQAVVRVPVGRDIIELLRTVIAGRRSTDPLLERWRHRQVGPAKWERAERAPWRSASEMTRPWAAIVQRAGLPSDTIPYGLRHASIVRGLRAGLPVRLVAALHDTSSAMIEAHYSAFITDALDELAARAVVPLSPSAGADVIPLWEKSA